MIFVIFLLFSNICASRRTAYMSELSFSHKKLAESGLFHLSLSSLFLECKINKLRNIRIQNFGKQLTDSAKYLEIAYDFLDQENWELAALKGLAEASACLIKAQSFLVLSSSNDIFEASQYMLKASDASGCINMASIVASPYIEEAGCCLSKYGLELRLFYDSFDCADDDGRKLQSAATALHEAGESMKRFGVLFRGD